MKLIDMLVEDGLNEWQWPEGAEKATAYRHIRGVHFWDGDGNRVDYIDLTTRELSCEGVTREQHEAELAAKKDGWIDFGGGECPVSASEMVDVIFGHGGRMSTNIADCWRWNHNGTDSDIIAYRLHQQQKSAQAKSDNESNLNEHIVKDAAQAWNGEGLPPVGCVCEVLYDEHEVLGNTWLKAKIISHDDGNVVGRWLEGNTEHTLFDYAINHRDYRQLRTEADKKRDAAVEQMMEFATIHTTKSLGLDLALRSCYNAIAAGKIPGVKLEG